MYVSTKHAVCLHLTVSVMVAFWSWTVWAQDLTPRAYVVTPVHSNAVTLIYSFYDGSILLDGALPVTDASGRVHVSLLSYYHSFTAFGRSANITAVLPYGVGTFQGKENGSQVSRYRSGLLDSQFRFAVNLVGGPAMTAQEMRKWKQKTIIGASFKVVAPTGQYDPTKLVNYGANRWSFKPEIALSQRWGDWLLDTYGAVWLFSANHQFFPGIANQTRSPIVGFEGHLSYDVRPRLWASFDSNFWFGGSTSVNGVDSVNTLQRNSRIGGTVSIPISKHQSLKFSYSDGVVVQYGGAFQNVSIAWQYSWLGRPN